MNGEEPDLSKNPHRAWLRIKRFVLKSIKRFVLKIVRIKSFEPRGYIKRIMLELCWNGLVFSCSVREGVAGVDKTCPYFCLFGWGLT
jgi:hypothetical protein